MPITLGQIAKHAGLSRQTVSNILNEKASLFRPETRARVARVCRELGYKPNAVARALRSGVFHAVGLVSSTDHQIGRIAPAALGGIEQALGQRGLHLVTGRVADAQLTDERYVPKLMRELLVDGMILNYTFRIPPRLRDLLEKNQLPHVWMNAPMETDCVRPDDAQGGRIATEHLLSLGHRRIAYVNLLHSEAEMRGGQLHYSILDRVTGYEGAMAAAGLEARLISRPEHLSESQSLVAPFTWLAGEDRPTGVVFHSPAGLGPLLVQFGERGMKMPEDLSVVVLVDNPFDLGGVEMDHVEVPHHQLGLTAVEAILRKISKPGEKQPAQVLPCVLRGAGASVAAPARTRTAGGTEKFPKPVAPPVPGRKSVRSHADAPGLTRTREIRGKNLIS